mmetsp:Transcript_118472/g.335032  ORF Transcript_118472/g.335032 Transcript_118472/m.335032 type:complete len:375 (+) Transcript_118472:1454-2578(+)
MGLGFVRLLHLRHRAAELHRLLLWQHAHPEAIADHRPLLAHVVYPRPHLDSSMGGDLEPRERGHGDLTRNEGSEELAVSAALARRAIERDHGAHPGDEPLQLLRVAVHIIDFEDDFHFRDALPLVGLRLRLDWRHRRRAGRSALRLGVVRAGGALRARNRGDALAPAVWPRQLRPLDPVSHCAPLRHRPRHRWRARAAARVLDGARVRHRNDDLGPLRLFRGLVASARHAQQIRGGEHFNERAGLGDAVLHENAETVSPSPGKGPPLHGGADEGQEGEQRLRDHVRLADRRARGGHRVHQPQSDHKAPFRQQAFQGGDPRHLSAGRAPLFLEGRYRRRKGAPRPEHGLHRTGQAPRGEGAGLQKCVPGGGELAW